MSNLSTDSQLARKNVLIIVPSVSHFDAISTSVRHTWEALEAMPGVDVKIMSWRCDLTELPWISAGDLSDLLLDDTFLKANLIIYHFGVHVNLFDAMVMGNGHGKQAVFFHNVTPARFLPEQSQDLIAASLRQIENFRRVDEIWPVSQINAEELYQRDFDPSRVHVIPLAVDTPALAPLADKDVKPLELVFVGRIVRSKGVLDLIAAMKQLSGRVTHPVRLRIVGNLEWSDTDYLAEVKAAIAGSGLAPSIELVGTASDEELQRIYHQSHILAIPSYHEGFCKPVIEALRGGLIPVGYAAYNLPHIAGGFGKLVPPGDIDALADALATLINALPQAFAAPEAPLLPLDRGATSLTLFDAASKTYVDRFTLSQFMRAVTERVRLLLDQ
ncbi:glycosyltransferase family 4 protein [Pseudochelatococcus contaminans]|uniref:Glycosyltransferase involved in cell wall biosynthesis n=1 Tax=Pseudochelatococcus contaminans TaxID=1538103 RepID=A0A7W5Z314_9HYPH|nr:glycosyltransferase family 4 protein [Pseudochelatococcus contaminans]MBB3809098.1 glycosyltransferase involved in cell wall biosynthesis [Pseudochelatococcus contaminans]